jgi:hypothetical protein
VQRFRNIVRFVVSPVLVLVAPLISAQQGTVSTAGTGTAGVHIESLAAYPDVAVKTGNATTSALRVFNSANTELLRVSANGNVGIGTASPGQKLEIFNGTPAGAVVISTPLSASFPANSAIGGLRLGWKYAGDAANNVDFQVVRGGNAIDGAGLAIYTSPSNASSAERMRITSAGNVGIGTGGPTSKLMVAGNTAGTWAFVSEQRSTYAANATTYDVAGTSQAYATISAGITNAGSALGMSGLAYLMGAGTLATSYGLVGETAILPAYTGTITNAHGVYARVARNNGVITNGYGLYIADVAATNDYGVMQVGVDDTNFFAGETTVGYPVAPGGPYTTKLTVNGNVTVAGTLTGASVIGATFQDLAEWVPATSDMEPGTVVVLNHERVNEVMPSHQAYDTSVAGVVSARPGIILGVGSDTKEQIATTGRVKVRVDATRAPVRIGDLLVTSDVSGTAMRSEPMEMNGRKFHQPGTIIGKALEPLEGGTREILVLLSLQ